MSFSPGPPTRTTSDCGDAERNATGASEQSIESRELTEERRDHDKASVGRDEPQENEDAMTARWLSLLLQV